MIVADIVNRLLEGEAEEFMQDFHKWTVKGTVYDGGIARIQWFHGLLGQVGEDEDGKVKDPTAFQQRLAGMEQMANWLETKFPFDGHKFFSVRDWMNEADAQGIMDQYKGSTPS